MAGNYHRWTKDEVRNLALQYARWADFDRDHNLATQAVRRHGWYDELCGHMRKRVVRLTREEVEAKAKLCSSRVQFYRTYPSEYGRALELGIIEELGIPRQFRRHTDESLRENAAQYSSLKAFYRSDYSAYEAANKRGILERICSHMTDRRMSGYQLYLYEFPDGAQYVGLTRRADRHSAGHRSKGPVFGYAKKHFEGRIPAPILLASDLRKAEAAAQERSEISRRRDQGIRLLNKSRGGETGGSPYAHSAKSIRRLAAQYGSFTDFANSEPAAYLWARRHGVELHFPPGRGKRTRWTRERVLAAVAECETYREFCERFPGAYGAMIDLDLTGLVQKKLPPKHAITEERRAQLRQSAREAFLRFETLKEFRESEPHLYAIAYQDGILTELEARGMQRLRREDISKTELASIAQNFSTRGAFQKAKPADYQAARRQEVLDEICAHMEPQKRRWTNETILATARAWNDGSISDFIRATGGLYNKARRIGIWEDVRRIVMGSKEEE